MNRNSYIPADHFLIETHNSALKYPYNSVTPVYHVAGYPVPEKFGDNCVSQAEHVANLVKACDDVTNVRYLINGRHHAVLCAYGSDLYFFDPYLLHVEPVNVTQQQALGAVGRMDAYPYFAIDEDVKKAGWKYHFPKKLYW